MSNALNKEIRTAIVQKALAQKFGEREAAFQAAKTAFADIAYSYAVGPNEENAVRKLAPRWVSYSNVLQIDCEGFSYRGERKHEDRNEEIQATLKMSKERPIPHDINQMLKIDKEHTLWPQTRVLVQERASILADRAALAQQIRTIIYSVNTRKRLLEVWPECAAFLPAPEPTYSTALVPVSTIQSVNKALGLP